MGDTGKDAPDLNLDDLLVQFPRALMRANAELALACTQDPALRQTPVIYQIPKMEVEIRLSLISRTGGLAALFAGSKTEERSNTIRLELLAAPRGIPIEAAPRVLRLQEPRMTGVDVKRLQFGLQSLISRLSQATKDSVYGAALNELKFTPGASTNDPGYPGKLQDLRALAESAAFADGDYGPVTAALVWAVRKEVFRETPQPASPGEVDEATLGRIFGLPA